MSGEGLEPAVVTAAADPAPLRATRRARTARRSLGAVGLVVVSVGLVIVAWELIKWMFGLPHSRLPHSWEVGRYLIDRDAVGRFNGIALLRALLDTVLEACLGMALALLVGFTLGITIAKAPLVGHAVEPIILLLRSLPIVAVAPPLVIWLGQGMAPIAIVSALTCFAPATIAVTRGIREVSTEQHALFRSIGATSWQLLAKLELPNVVAQLAAAIQVIASWAVLGAIVGELPAGNATGIGGRLLAATAFYTYRPESLWAASITAVVGAIALVAISTFAFRRVAMLLLQTSWLPAEDQA